MRLHNRLIRPGFWTDTELILALPMAGRMYYMGLVQLAEDSGVVEDNTMAHKIHLFPGDMDVTPDVIKGWRDTLVEMGKLIPYEVGGKRCLFLKNFHKHQKLRKPASPDLPLPPWVAWNEPYEEIVDGRKVQRNGFYSISGSYEVDMKSVSTSHSREPEPEPEPEPEREPEDPPRSPPAGGTASSPPSDVEAFHAHYCERWRDVFPRGPRLTQQRRRKIIARLRAFSLDEMKRAADNLHKSPYHRGDNPQGTAYGTIDFLIRNDEQIDKWANTPPIRAAPGRPRSGRESAVTRMLREEGVTFGDETRGFDDPRSA